MSLTDTATEPEHNLRSASIDTLKPDDRFKWNDDWYAWQHVTQNDARMIARLLKPNQFNGAVTTTGHSMLPGSMVEIIDWDSLCET